MEELIKKVAEALRDYILKSPEFKAAVTDGLSENVTEIVDARLDYHGLTDGISGKVEIAIDNIDWGDLISDNLDTGSGVFRDGVREAIRDMEFRVEVY